MSAISIALGKRGVTAFNIIGSNTDIDAAEDFVVGGGNAPAPVASGSAYLLEVISADAADDGDPAGTGALTVVVEGIDANGNLQTATVTMNGTTAVAIPTVTWTAVNRAYVATVGSSLANVGAITVRVAGAGATKLTIPAGVGLSDGAFYLVPKGHTLLILSAEFGVLSAGVVTTALMIDGRVRYVNVATTALSHDDPYHVPIAAKAGEFLRARALAVSAVDQSARASLECLLVEDGVVV